MKKKKKKTLKKQKTTKLIRLDLSRGFTMVELIATVVLLGILSAISIAAIQGTIKRARDEYHHTQENNFIAAARSYAEKNQQHLPKISGQTTQVSLGELRKAKYINRITDYSKKTCNENSSYVQIFLYENSYYYTPYLVCPTYTSNEIEKYENYSMELVFSGGVTDSKGKLTIQEPKAGIVSYNYRIYADGKQVYASEIFQTAKKESVDKTISLVDYTPSNIKVVVTATNGTGVVLTKNFEKDYTDQKPSDNPLCGANPIGASTTWISSSRKISISCTDPGGIGCAKSTFTKQFDTSMQQGEIKIYDKAGNYNLCMVDVYIDKESPTISLTGYKRNVAGQKEGNSVGSATANNTNKTNSFKITSNLTNGWLNGYQYPNGVVLELKYEDLSPIKNIEWKINAPKLKGSAANVKTYTSTNYTPNVSSTDYGTYLIQIPDEGYRFGEVIVTDSAGNKSSITVEIPMDFTPPTKPAPRPVDIQNPDGLNWNGKGGGNKFQEVPTGQGSTDAGSDDAMSYLYCFKTADGYPSKEDACFTSSRTYERACGRTIYAYEIAVDTAGNRSEVSKIGQGSDPATNYNSWTTCTQSCGNSGTTTGTSVCALDPQKVEACNRRDCCSSTYAVERNDCSASCDWGNKKRDFYSNYNGQSCGSDWGGGGCYLKACLRVPDGVPSGNCNIRGNTIKYNVNKWDCSSRYHTSHTYGYIHYCTDINGTLVFRDDYTKNLSKYGPIGYVNRNYNRFRWACSDRPYTAAQGWTVMSD